MRKRIDPPFRGAANHTPHRATPGEFCPPSSLLNIRRRDRRIGQRPGLGRLFGTRMGGGKPVQKLLTVERASVVTGYVPFNAQLLSEWESRVAGVLQGQAWVLDPEMGMRRDFYADVTLPPFSASSNQGASAVAFHPAGVRLAFAVLIPAAASTSGLVELALTLVRVDGTVLGSARIVSASVVADACCVAFHDEYLFVGFGANLYTFRSDTLALLDTRNPATCQRVVALAVANADEPTSVSPSATPPALYVAFNGDSTGATLSSGVAVTAGDYARQFRSGVVKYAIGTLGSELTQEVWGAPAALPSTYFESDHRTHRVSEHTQNRPHGCLMTGVAVAPDGGLLYTRTNQGRGPNAGHQPSALLQPCLTLVKLDATGRIEWERDTDSIREAGDLGLINDIPTGAYGYENYGPGDATVAGDGPSANAVAVGADGTIFVAGQRNDATATVGVNVLAFESDGTERWRLNLSGTIPLGALAVDLTTGNLWAAGARNANWDGAAGNTAHLWELRAQDGTVLRWFDLAPDTPSATGVAVNGEGQIAYTTGYVS